MLKIFDMLNKTILEYKQERKKLQVSKIAIVKDETKEIEKFVTRRIFLKITNHRRCEISIKFLFYYIQIGYKNF